MVCADDAYGHSSAAVVRERIRREILAEQELLLAPEFFVALPDYLPISRRWMCSSSGCTRSTNSAVTAMRWCW